MREPEVPPLRPETYDADCALAVVSVLRGFEVHYGGAIKALHKEIIDGPAFRMTSSCRGPVTARKLDLLELVFVPDNGPGFIRVTESLRQLLQPVKRYAGGVNGIKRIAGMVDSLWNFEVQYRAAVESLNDSSKREPPFRWHPTERRLMTESVIRVREIAADFEVAGDMLSSAISKAAELEARVDPGARVR
ncbi:hypothetical protein E3O42_16195 [Cryobacterium adonitolivorans]|uniref:Uncharacterized protein n=1 Tax=Cryobacterium adonitolivorans TaxID=1259189 RepID=A0A4R8VY71_9MICO|nr:hypothetical protein [Cryobacterium adonitolivorans]TFB97478.1 hypothetical protein E3O42_16195 [Cryobacterium adonitolivorans]